MSNMQPSRYRNIRKFILPQNILYLVDFHACGKQNDGVTAFHCVITGGNDDLVLMYNGRDQHVTLELELLEPFELFVVLACIGTSLEQELANYLELIDEIEYRKYRLQLLYWSIVVKQC